MQQRLLPRQQSSSSLPLATLNAYEASINGARTSVSGALRHSPSANTALTGAQGTLTLAEAGATTK